MFRIPYLAFYIIACVLAAVCDGHTDDGPQKAHVGYLIDMFCARQRKASESDLGSKHTRNCLQMPICVRSGFGLLIRDREVIAFDAKGNRMAQSLIDKTSRLGHLLVRVRGTISARELQVTDIYLIR